MTPSESMVKLDATERGVEGGNRFVWRKARSAYIPLARINKLKTLCGVNSQRLRFFDALTAGIVCQPVRIRAQADHGFRQNLRI